jgi:DNA helicase-4
LNGELYLSDDQGNRVEIELDSLGSEELYSQGLLFSTLKLQTSEGLRTLRWLPKSSAKSAYHWLTDIWYHQIASDVSRAASQVRLIMVLGYLRDSRLESIRAIALPQLARFRKLPPKGTFSDSVHDDFTLLYSFATWKRADVAVHRESYVDAERLKYADYFDSVESNPLTESQREACIVDQDNNLVLAGAGTGKTSTIVGRAGYLIRSGQAQPHQVLMLAFANKAATEMQERVNAMIEEKGVVVSTFHKLGKDIIASVEGGQPSITPLAEDDKLLAFNVNSWFEAEMEKFEYRAKVLDYFKHYLYPAKNSFEFDSEGEYFEYILANEIRTLKGEVVKSLGECLIANHLFKLGIEYQYEAEYEHSTRTVEYRQYQPDFYLPDYGVYIEYLGIARDGSTAPYVDREAYHARMEWMRDLHKRNETVLLQTYHYERTEGVLLNSLENQLEQAKVEFNPLPPESVLETLREFGAISAFSNLLSQLLRRYKAGGFSAERLSQVVASAADPEQVSAALELLKPILDEYEKSLAEAHQIDFDDMIGRAIPYIQKGLYRSKWRYILVDEFQDISEPRARLVKALRDSVADCSLFCVGDDWQSIYRFSGSDIAFTTSFEDEFGPTKITALDKTYRFNNSICDVASEFVLRNPAQVRKKLSTHARVNQSAVSVLRKSPGRSNGQSDIDIRLYEVLTKISKLAEPGSTVFLLARFGFHLPSAAAVAGLKKIYPTLRISALTMHASKGREADYVVLLGLQTGKHGFPSRKVTHPLLEALLPKLEQFPFAEERRLFYVALTRARHRVYLICDMAVASEFVSELVTEKYAVELEEFETSLAQKLFQAINCNRCTTGTMVPREGMRGAFYGCSHFPLCDYTENGCRACANPMQRRGGFKVCINPECGEWVPTCPKCGAEMTLRDGPRGKFWGCRNYRGSEAVSCSHTENSIDYEPEHT